MQGSDFVFDCAHLLYYKYHKINLNCGASNTGFPNQLKNKKAIINPTNKKDN